MSWSSSHAFVLHRKSGGGHQDQVGGLLGGVKITRSAASLPLQACMNISGRNPSGKPFFLFAPRETRKIR